jgi:hypothetical protein
MTTDSTDIVAWAILVEKTAQIDGISIGTDNANKSVNQRSQ